jgi:hypothetical protein
VILDDIFNGLLKFGWMIELVVELGNGVPSVIKYFTIIVA